MTTNTTDSEERFKMGTVIGNRWKIVQKVDAGGFGSVYKVQHIKDDKLFAALKVEPSQSDEVNHIKLETAVLKQLHASGIRAHVPQLFRSAKRTTYCYMIITLLGDNLHKLKERHCPAGMPLRSWTRIAVQCLYGIKTMHDRGFVHRDIKAQNFVLGYSGTPEFARVVYIIDFGLSRAYAFPPTDGSKQWRARKARLRLDFRGTYRYAAPSMHEESEQGRKDDIWSFLYLMIDLYCGLPWSEKDSIHVLETKKLHMKDEDLMTRMPAEVKFIPEHLRTLDVYQRPDYHRIYQAFEVLRKRTKTSYEDAYEWETREAAETNLKAMRDKHAPIGYTNAEVFFKSDPVNVNGVPKEAEETKRLSVVEKVHEKKSKMDLISLEDAMARGTSIKQQPTTPGKSPPNKSPAVSPTTRRKITRRKTSRSSGSERRGPKTKTPVKARKKVSKDRSSEESDDFVPSCYLNTDVPLHYLEKANENAKDFQKRMVLMDWGHSEAPKACMTISQSPPSLVGSIPASPAPVEKQEKTSGSPPAKTAHEVPDSPRNKHAVDQPTQTEAESPREKRKDGDRSEKKKKDEKSEKKKNDERSEKKKDNERSEKKKDNERSEKKKDNEKSEKKKNDERSEKKKDDEKSEKKKDNEKSEKKKKDNERSEKKKDHERSEKKKDNERSEKKNKDNERSEKKKDNEKSEKKKDIDRSEFCTRPGN